MLSVVLARPETSALLSFILKFEKVRSPSIRYLYWQYVPLRPSRAAGEGGERRNALVRHGAVVKDPNVNVGLWRFDCCARLIIMRSSPRFRSRPSARTRAR